MGAAKTMTFTPDDWVQLLMVKGQEIEFTVMGKGTPVQYEIAREWYNDPSTFQDKPKISKKERATKYSRVKPKKRASDKSSDEKPETPLKRPLVNGKPMSIQIPQHKENAPIKKKLKMEDIFSPEAIAKLEAPRVGVTGTTMNINNVDVYLWDGNEQSSGTKIHPTQVTHTTLSVGDKIHFML